MQNLFTDLIHMQMFVFSLATSQYYGFVGGGTLFLLQTNVHGTLDEIKSFEWSDGLFDLVSFNRIKQYKQIHFVYLFDEIVQW